MADLSNAILRRLVLEMTRKEIGKIQNYFRKIGVAEIELSGELAAGQKVLIEGENISFEQSASSLKIDHQKVESAGTCRVRMKVVGEVRKNNVVYLV